MKIVHASDWHGNFRTLSPADVYVFTGDMLTNYPSLRYSLPGTRRAEVYDPHRTLLGSPPDEPPPANYVPLDRVIDPRKEKVLQERWLAGADLRQYLGSPAAPVVVVRGNHDFADLAPGFGGDVFEVGLDAASAREIGGLKFGGCRGVTPISGEWSDETPDLEFDLRADRLPGDLDVLVTHSPPAGVMDWFGAHLGSRALMRYVSGRIYGTEQDGRRPLRAHLFGHIHEMAGVEGRGGVVFSNAATTSRELEV